MPLNTNERADPIPSQSNRQKDTNNFSDNFLVRIYSSFWGGVTARVPEELQLQIASEWDSPLSGKVSGIAEIAAQEAGGTSLQTQELSAQIWSGSSPIEITLPLEFYADTNPKLEVIKPIVTLARMALPSKSGNAGFLSPPGPRVFNQSQGDTISIDIGNFMNFKKVIVTAVNPTFVTRDMTQEGLPLRATCELTFRSMFSLTGDEFARMLKDIK